IAEPLALMRQAKPALDEIRRLAGPSRERLARLGRQLTAIAHLLEKISVPDEVTAPHDLFKTAVQLASRAAQGRQHAVMAGSMPAARDASSAAAGALMLFDKAATDLQTLL